MAVESAFGPIGQLPRGLMGLLGIKSQSYPQVLAGQVAPTIDLMRFLLDGNALDQVTASASATTYGTLNSGLGPEGREAWLIRGFAAEATLSGTEYIAMRAGVFRTAGTGLLHALVSDNQGAPSRTGFAAVVISVLNGPFIVQPGDVLGAAVQAHTAVAGITVDFTASILRIPF